MSLFIANLAFADPATRNQAKVGGLAASVVAALAGMAFRRNLRQPQAVVAAA
jgi:Na+/H+ antiporter NhaA